MVRGSTTAIRVRVGSGIHTELRGGHVLLHVVGTVVGARFSPVLIGT